MEEILRRFFDIVADPYTSVAQWKERSKKKVIGVFPMHIPEEIIHAARMLPVVIWRGNEPVTIGHAHVPPFNCGLTRSFVDDALRGKLDFLDGMVFWRMCLQAQSLPFIIERNVHPPYLEYLYLPAIFPGKDNHPGAAIRDFTIGEMERLKQSIEELSGQKTTAESLNRSIDIYNQNRHFLREVYKLRRRKPGALKAREMLAIVQSGMLMPKEEHNELLEKLLPELEKRPASSDKKVRVILAGSLCQTPPADVLDLVEELGMEVVDDDIYIGSRYFANDVKTSSNPIESLAERYLQRTPPCATKGDWEMDWTDYLIEMVRSNQAQGIITLLIKFCPPHLCYYPDIKRKLAELGIPEVLVELEHEVVSLEQHRTRLQSFREIIGGA